MQRQHFATPALGEVSPFPDFFDFFFFFFYSTSHLSFGSSSPVWEKKANLARGGSVCDLIPE